MSDSEFSDRKILSSWQKNAAPWIKAIDEASITSRNLVTDAAIVDAVLKHRPSDNRVTQQEIAGQPESILDVGCGEGWLSRALSGPNTQLWGVDAIPALISRAQQQAGANQHYQVATYEELAADSLQQRYDKLVCNFSLIGKESVTALFAAAPTLLQPGGRFIVQTLHPNTACGDLPYQDGWRQGSWDGFSRDFSDPAPWYFRTLASWLALFIDCGLAIEEVIEPLHPHTGLPASLIIVGKFVGKTAS